MNVLCAEQKWRDFLNSCIVKRIHQRKMFMFEVTKVRIGYKMLMLQALRFPTDI